MQQMCTILFPLITIQTSQGLSWLIQFLNSFKQNKPVSWVKIENSVSRKSRSLRKNPTVSDSSYCVPVKEVQRLKSVLVPKREFLCKRVNFGMDYVQDWKSSEPKSLQVRLKWIQCEKKIQSQDQRLEPLPWTEKRSVKVRIQVHFMDGMHACILPSLLMRYGCLTIAWLVDNPVGLLLYSWIQSSSLLQAKAFPISMVIFPIWNASYQVGNGLL